MPDFKNTVGGRFLTMLEAQAPANFAMVMSTGIVYVAFEAQGEIVPRRGTTMKARSARTSSAASP